MQSTPPVRPLPEQPIPVWAGLFLVIGVILNGFSFFSSLYLLFNETARLAAQISVIGIGLSMALYLATIVLAVIAWKGSRKAIIAFLTLNTISMGLLVFNNVYLGLTKDLGDETFDNWKDVVRGLFLIVWYLYYFTRNTQKAYFSK
ncbi:hypothetical protein SDC9_153412 [bioreactor metagenome]|uniref:DUF2569 domain-containing protein n=1 Tax=bioreactor metagenome TaxID=1076179 RepID=A0A645EXL1_9ZZZZ